MRGSVVGVILTCPHEASFVAALSLIQKFTEFRKDLPPA